ncbi:MAG TPA: PspC domain-containing protein [Chitinophagaceae bacterium]|nr:PspC domain-containing protein [Chitinophagaceae bacterium]
MNKIFDINLGGLPFQIDDNAYEALTIYLTTLKNHFAHTVGYEEILNDIESRLAEMFSEKIKNGSRIISMVDVEEATTIMGKPEQMDESENVQQEQTQQKTKEAHQQPNEHWYRRRLYRNADDKILGGVCSGLGATLGVDKVWIRLAFACSILLLGTGALLYIILWIIIPEAKSATEKLEMQGEPINIHNIGKQIEEDAKAFGEHMKKWGEEVKSTFKNYTKKEKRDYLQKQKTKSKSIFHVLWRGIIRFIVIIFKIVFLFILLAFTLVVLRGLGWEAIGNYPYEFSNIFATSIQSNIILISLLITLSISIAIGIIGLLKYIFHFKFNYTGLKYLRGGVISIAFIILMVTAIMVVNDFSHQGKVSTEIPITTVDKNKLYIHLVHNGKEEGDEDELFLADRTVSLQIEPSTDSAFHLEKYSYARSSKRSAAEALAKKTIVPIVQHDSVIEIGNYYDWLPSKKWRNQFVELTLKIPKNKIAYIHRNIFNHLDVHFSNVYMEDAMAFTGLYAQWTTVDKGLACLNVDTSAR